MGFGRLEFSPFRFSQSRNFDLIHPNTDWTGCRLQTGWCGKLRSSIRFRPASFGVRIRSRSDLAFCQPILQTGNSDAFTKFLSRQKGYSLAHFQKGLWGPGYSISYFLSKLSQSYFGGKDLAVSRAFFVYEINQ